MDFWRLVKDQGIKHIVVLEQQVSMTNFTCPSHPTDLEQSGLPAILPEAGTADDYDTFKVSSVKKWEEDAMSISVLNSPLYQKAPSMRTPGLE